MKRSLILSLVCALGLCLAQVDSYAQYQRGDVIIGVGPTLGYWYGSGASYASGFSVGGTAYAEFSCILDEIAIGPYLGFSRRSYDYIDDYNVTFIDFGVRGSYHFGKLLKVPTDQFDPYAGAQLGFVVANDNYDGNDIYDPGVDGRLQAGVYAGARWYFTDNFGVFGEAGIGIYPVTLGVTFKVK